MNENKLNEKDIEIARTLSMSPSIYDKYIVLLKNDFGYNLTKSNLATVLNKSQQTIDRRIKESRNIPNYIRSGEGVKCSYLFPIAEVALYLSNNLIKSN